MTTSTRLTQFFLFLQASRIENELRKDHSLMDLGIRVKSSERDRVWIGCSVYVSLSTYRKFFLYSSILVKEDPKRANINILPYLAFSTIISKEDYDQMGPSAIHLFYNYPMSD